MKYCLSAFIFLLSYLVNAQDESRVESEAKKEAFRKLYKSSASAAIYPGDSNIDVKYYKLNLTFTEYPSNYINGIITMKAAAAGTITSIFLDLKSNLTVSSVVCGSISLSFSQSDNKLYITLNKSYSAGEEFTIDITYSGSPTSGSGSISSASISFYDSNYSKKVISTLSEPYGARDWWPCKDDPADKADSSDVWITANEWYTSVSNGSLEEALSNGDGTKTYKWKNHYPIASYLISVAMTNYGTYEDTWEYASGKTMPLIHYCYPEKMNSTRAAAVAKTKSMLAIFSDKYGLYPYIKEKYGHAEFAWSGGMEHQTVTSMGGNSMSSERVISHELAHQWFGDKVTCKNWQNIWLNEGFATYSEAVYREGKEGNSGYISEIESDLSAAKSASGTLYVQDITDENEIFDYSRSYQKGSAVIHMLRGVIADSGKFFTILRNYLQDPALAYGVATTEDFQAHAEALYGASLEYFFDEWVYGENYPVYTVTWNRQNISGNTYSGVVTINQQTNSNPVYFTMPIQLKFTTGSGDTTITVFNNAQTQSFNYTINGKPTKLTFDPDNLIMKTVNSVTFDSTSTPETSGNYSLRQNYPNPFSRSTLIRYQLQNESNVVLKIYDPLGREIAVLENERKSAGYYNVTFSASQMNLPSGVYFYSLQTDNYKETKKMVFVK